MNPLLRSIEARPQEPVIQTDDLVLTGNALRTRIEQLATKLKSANVRRLALIANNSAEWIICDLACHEAGICIIPLPHFFSDSQLRNGIDRSGATAVATDDPMRLRRLLGHIGLADLPDVPTELRVIRVDLPGNPPIPRGTSKITFTSGSTGEPRGVCLSALQQMNVARALAAAMPDEQPRHLCLLPLSTLLENVAGVYYPLLSGGTIVVLPNSQTGLAGGSGLDAQRLIRSISQAEPTSLILLPQMLMALVQALSTGWQPPQSLRFAAVGGGKVSSEILLRARSHGLPVYEGYGLSETASVACLNIPGRDVPGSVGHPLDHVDVSVDNGDVIVGGNSFLGYIDDASSWYPATVDTGDIGELDEFGFLHIRGRIKNILISSFGRNISPEWVESLLLANPKIGQVIVLGDARPYCIALISANDPTVSDVDIRNCIDHANAELPDYARVLNWYRLQQHLTARDGLLTDNGKPIRTAIENHFRDAINSLYAYPEVANAR